MDLKKKPGHPVVTVDGNGNPIVRTAEETRIRLAILSSPSHTDLKWGIGESATADLLSVIILLSGFDVKLAE